MDEELAETDIRDRVDLIETAHFVQSAAASAQGVAFLVTEWQLSRGQRGLSSVDHSGHLTGFAAGVGFLAIVRIGEFVAGWYRNAWEPLSPRGSQDDSTS